MGKLEELEKLNARNWEYEIGSVTWVRTAEVNGEEQVGCEKVYST